MARQPLPSIESIPMQTPLFHQHQALGARMAPFAGWEMPIQYRGILPEHEQTRQQASIFDTCHMGEFEITGPDAESDLERLLTQRVSSLKPGQCRYGYMLREDGGVLDDLMVFRRATDRFFVVVNAGTRENDAAWIRAHLSTGTRFEDLSPGRGKLDVQGPAARPAMERALGSRLPDLAYFRFVDLDLANVPVTLSRTGYTGEFGYEIFLPADATARLWEVLTHNGEILPAGLGARDTLRLEAGYPLYGHELSETQSPVSASRGAFMDLQKVFIGKPIVEKELQGGPTRFLAGLTLESKRAARAGDRVLADGKEVGEITSGSLAPSLGVAVAMAYAQASLCTPGTRLQVAVRGGELPATVVEMPFYREGTARKPANWPECLGDG